jgi:hypothetical protein
LYDREAAFNAKFASASQHLGVTPDQIISMKLRDSVSSYDEYREMLEVLEHEAGLHWSEIGYDLQGRGYLVDHDGEKIIVVEHETGLEILYIAGSIASLLGLPLIVLQYWAAVRGHLDRRHGHHFASVEIRRVDTNGKLSEEHSRSLAGPSAFALSVVALSSAVRIVDADILALRHEVRLLNDRLVAIEKQGKPARDGRPKKSLKPDVGSD